MNLANSPLSSKTGSQSIRFSEVAPLTPCSPQYIQYFPFILVTTSLSFFKVVNIEADLWEVSINLVYFDLANIGPCFSHVLESLDVAAPRRGVSRIHWVWNTTKVSSCVTAIRVSETPHAHPDAY